MFDVGPSELLLIVVVAVVVIGPKDLPRVLYKLGQVIGQAKSMARHFRTGVDAMIREAELEELQKQWAKENERIMAATAVPELDGVMKPLAGESGQPPAADAPLLPSDEIVAGEAGADTPTAPSEASSPVRAAAPAGVEAADAGSNQPRLPLEGTGDAARGGSSAS